MAVVVIILVVDHAELNHLKDDRSTILRFFIFFFTNHASLANESIYKTQILVGKINRDKKAMMAKRPKHLCLCVCVYTNYVNTTNVSVVILEHIMGAEDLILLQSPCSQFKI